MTTRAELRGTYREQREATWAQRDLLDSLREDLRRAIQEGRSEKAIQRLRDSVAREKTKLDDLREGRDTALQAVQQWDRYREEAAILLPWLPPQLAREFANNWVQYGEYRLAYAATQTSETYDQFFPGIKREDGSLRMSEMEYLAVLEGYRDSIADWGLNPQFFEDLLIQNIAGNVSPQEFRSRLDAMQERIWRAGSEYVESFTRFFGGTDPETTRRAMFAMALDPSIGDGLLGQRIKVAEIAGAAAVQGYRINKALATRLDQYGVDKGQSASIFGFAAANLPALDRLAARQHTGGVSLENLLGAQVFGEHDEMRRLERSVAGESSRYTEQGSIEMDRSLAQTGLRRK